MSAAAETPVPPPRSAGPECRCWPAKGPCGGSAVRELRMQRRAEPAAVSALRRLLRDWLAGSDLEQGTVDAVVLAVDEAVTNCVEHAYPSGAPGMVRVVVTRPVCGGERGVAVLIEDEGRWRPVPIEQGFHGRGLLLIHGLPDRATITDSSHGTIVRRCWTRDAAEWPAA